MFSHIRQLRIALSSASVISVWFGLNGNAKVTHPS